ncbi:MAG TPA: hypothetical protein VMZ03_07145 [Chitinophagaceae bacterium]|nr:hypothetical protein [Chitinophagaceae bacterium]
MKDKPFRSSFLLLLLLLLSISVIGQFRDVKWEPWQAMPCFQGISVSVLNMGYGKEAGGYLWGIRIRNDYNTPVRVNYKLTIGEENKVATGFMTSGLLKKGDVWTDGGDVFTANLFKSSSKEYFVALDKVCFDGFKCGGNDECYADCDALKGVPNQSCGFNDNAAVKNKPLSIETGIWTDGNPGSTIKLIKIEEGIIFLEKEEGGSAWLYKTISPGHYRIRYFGGDSSNHADLLIADKHNIDHYRFNYHQNHYKFTSPLITERSDWAEDGYENTKRAIIKTENGLFVCYDIGYSVMYYPKSGTNEFKDKEGIGYEFIGNDQMHFLPRNDPKGFYYHKAKKQNKRSFAGKVNSNIGDCIWQSERNNQKFKIKIASDGIYMAALDADFGSTPSWPGAGNGIYEAHNGHTTIQLRFVNDKRYGVSYNGGSPDYFNCISDLENADEWVHVRDKYAVKIIEQEGGVLFNGSGNIILFTTIAKDTYQASDRPCTPDCYKTIIHFTGKDSFTVQYTNLQGQVNQTDEFVRKKK